MLAEERKRKILELIAKNRIVKVAELSKTLDATEATIRRDLQELQDHDQLKRIHGGAIPANKANYDFHFSELSVLRIDEKKIIAQRAFEFVRDKDTLLMDGSTTVYELGKLILDSTLCGLSIITTSFNLMTLFAASDRKDIRIIHTGGELSSSMNFAVGAVAEQMLAGIRADKCFLGTNGIDPDYGFSVPSFADASIKKHMLRASKCSFILADNTKFWESYMAKFADFSGTIDYMITDKIPSDMKNDIHNSVTEFIEA